MKVIFKLFLFGVLLSVKTPGFTQQSLADSLSKVLKSAKEDTGRVNTLNLLCRTFWLRGDYDSAQKIADESLSLSSKLKSKKGNADALVCMGLIKMEQGDYAKALENLFAGLKIFDSLGLKGKVASVYNNIGLTYSQRGNYSESLKNYFLSLKISKELNSKSEIASCYNNISIVYKVQGNLVESLKSEFEALKIYDQLFATPLPEKDRISNKSGQANIYGNMGNIFTLQHNYSDALKSFISSRKIFEEIGNKTGLEKTYIGSGTIYFYMGDETTSSPKKRDSLLQQALSDYMKTLSITRETGNKKDEATACGNIGNVYHNLGNISEAMKYYMMDLKSSEEAGDKDNIATSCVNIGAIYLKQKKYLDAEKYYNKALSVSKEMGDAEGMMDCYEGLSIVDSAKGDFKSALLHYKMQSIYKDSLQNEENTKKTVRLQMQYDFDKKEELARLEQEKKDAIVREESRKQKIILYSVSGFLLLVLGFALVTTRQKNIIRREKKRSEELLLNILPAETAEELKQKNSVASKQYDVVTVMFTDFKDFTSTAEKMQPADLVSQLHFCFKKFDEIISRYPIEKIKTIGDAYMCAGGLPVPNATNPADVVSAALDIQKFMAEWKQEQQKNGLPFWEIRIGVHTGPIVAGIVGIKKFAYDIWGDTVNTASRMESSGEAGKVNISEFTQNLIVQSESSQKFNFIYRGEIEAKHKGKIKMYFAERS